MAEPLSTPVVLKGVNVWQFSSRVGCGASAMGGVVVTTLKTNEQIRQLLRSGEVVKNEFFSLYVLPLSQEENKIAFVALVPKRLAKRAVTRNCIKRQVRAKINQLKHHLVSFELLIKLHKKIAADEFLSAGSVKLKQVVSSQLESLLGQFIAQKDKDYVG